MSVITQHLFHLQRHAPLKQNTKYVPSVKGYSTMPIYTQTRLYLSRLLDIRYSFICFNTILDYITCALLFQLEPTSSF
jgi:hypothetical protein